MKQDNSKPVMPRTPYSIGVIGSVPRILDARGNDVLNEDGGMERLVECANALRKVHFPAAHVEATDEYVKRLEELRTAAWNRAESLDAELERMKRNMAEW